MYPRAGSALGAVLQAFYARATSDPTLGALVGTRIYTRVPDNEVFPYVSLDTYVSSPFDTHARTGEEILIGWNIWSMYDGTAEVEAIASAFIRLFGERTDLVMPGWDVIGCWYDSSRLVDTSPMQMSVRFRLLVQAAENP